MKYDISTSRLFVGGNGCQNFSSSLSSWDLRNPYTRINEREKGIDIFSLCLKNRNMYMGLRNHYVRYFDIDKEDFSIDLQPPHFDRVSCLASIQDNLISG